MCVWRSVEFSCHFERSEKSRSLAFARDDNRIVRDRIDPPVPQLTAEFFVCPLLDAISDLRPDQRSALYLQKPQTRNRLTVLLRVGPAPNLHSPKRTTIAVDLFPALSPL